MRLFCVLVIVLAACACSESARDSLGEARAALAESRYAEAVVAADDGLALDADEVTAWGLELVKLEALAREGRGDETLNHLEELAVARFEHVTAAQYSTTADQLRAAGQGASTIQVLDLGLQRFPDDETLLAMIEEAKAAPAPGGDELEMLRSLGYIE